MSYLALYRKYRPSGFDGLIGQDNIVKTLTNQINSGMIGHAYLFTGTRGTGKTSTAKIFAKAINCTSPVNGSPCGKCDVCKALSDPSNIDIIEIDAASNNGVNEIRDLREKVQYPPVSCKYKVYIIDEVHMLTGAAFNALLKTLEEPPKHAVFILATTEVHKIPATILSRCMRFDFKLVPTNTIASLIEKIYKEQKKEFDKEAVYAIAKAGEGSVRDALSIADIALSYSDKKLTYDDVMEILGSNNVEFVKNFIVSILNEDTGKVLESIFTMCSMGKSIGVLVKDVISFIRDLIIIKSCEKPNEILALPVNLLEEYKDVVANVTKDKLLRILDIYTNLESNIKYSSNQRVMFESASIKASRSKADYDYDSIISRLKELENKVKNGTIINSEAPIKEQCSQTEKTDKIAVEKKSINDFNKKDIKSILLKNVRENGSELLYNLLQNVEINIDNNTLTIFANSEGDKDILEKENSKEMLTTSLNMLLPFNLVISQKETSVKSDQIEDASNRIKEIFGSDIVIIK